jgi:hypothetical protein
MERKPKHINAVPKSFTGFSLIVFIRGIDLGGRYRGGEFSVLK